MSDTKNNSKELFGYVAEFGSASELYHAAEKVRDAGFRKWDVHTPFPVHGLEKLKLPSLHVVREQSVGNIPDVRIGDWDTCPTDRRALKYGWKERVRVVSRSALAG